MLEMVSPIPASTYIALKTQHYSKAEGNILRGDALPGPASSLPGIFLLKQSNFYAVEEVGLKTLKFTDDMERIA